MGWLWLGCPTPSKAYREPMRFAVVPPYGASTITKPDGMRSENELAGARFESRHLAQIAAKLKA